jgi:hypothetical protein
MKGVLALAALGLACRAAPPPSPDGPTPAELTASKQRRAALQQRFERAAAAAGYGFAEAPSTGVVIGTPTAFAANLVEQIVTGFLGEVTLVLRDLDVHATSDVRGNLLFKRRTLGELELDIGIQEVKGILKPSRPRLRFQEERIGIALPVRLASGDGRASVRVRWDGRGIAGVACGDVDVTRQVQGALAPASYEVKGAFELRTRGPSIVVTPRFPDVEVKIQIQPDAESWATFEGVIEEQGAVCRTLLRKADVRQKVAEVIERGFDVRLPRKLFRPLELPAGVEESVEIEGVRLALEAKPRRLAISHGRIWYGADVVVRRDLAKEARASSDSASRSPLNALER